MTIRVRLSQGTLLRSVLVLAIFSVACAECASAATAIVETADCTTTGVNAALAAATASSTYTAGTPITIQIAAGAVCTEGVVVSGLSNVVLNAVDPTNPPTFSPSASGLAALQISNSNNVYVNTINFTGPGTAPGPQVPQIPLVVVQSSNVVTFAACNFTKATGTAIQVSSSQVSINGPSTIGPNNQNGISSTASNLSIGGWGPTQAVQIENNSFDGISVSQGGYLFLYEYVTVSQNGDPTGKNTFAGVALGNAEALLCCGNSYGPIVDGNYGWGIDAEELSSVTIVGGNGPNLSISGNTQGGIYVNASWVGIYNGVTVQRNGDNTQTSPLGGIDVLANGALQAYGATIENNFGPGLLVSQSSSADVGAGATPTTISGNTGSGIYVQVNGSVQFDGAGTTLTGNTPRDLTCAAAGIAAEDSGTPPTIGTKSCGNLFDLPPRKHKKAKS